MLYLVQYRCDGVFDAKVMDISELAILIGFCDCNECDDFDIYRLIPDKAPEKLRYSKECCILWLEDRYGNPVASCEYPDH